MTEYRALTDSVLRVRWGLWAHSKNLSSRIKKKTKERERFMSHDVLTFCRMIKATTHHVIYQKALR